MKNWGKYLSWLLGGVFLFSAISKLFPIDIFSAKLLEYKFFDWKTARWFSRLLVSVELGIGLGLLLPSTIKKRAALFGLLLTAVFSVMLVYQLIRFGDTENCHCFGDWLPLSNKESLIKNGFLLAGLSLVLRNAKPSIPRKWMTLTALAFPFVSMLVVCILWPPIDIYDHPQGNTREGQNLIPTLRGGKSEVNVLALSTNCEHCRQIAFNLGSASIAGKINSTNYHLLLEGKDSLAVENFLNEARLSDFSYRKINDLTFLNLTMGSYPKLFVTRNDTIREEIQAWDLMKNGF